MTLTLPRSDDYSKLTLYTRTSDWLPGYPARMLSAQGSQVMENLGMLDNVSEIAFTFAGNLRRDCLLVATVLPSS